jgi:hypothetical protein
MVAGYRLADLTRPDDGGSGVRRVGVVLGLEGRHGGGVELAAGRRGRGQALKVPFEAGGGVHLHKPCRGVAWVGEGMGDPVGIRMKLPAGAESCRCSTVNTTVPSRT